MCFNVFIGVCHADELFLMFTAGYLPRISTADDIKVSETLLDLWTSFAKNGYITIGYILCKSFPPASIVI